MLQLYRYQVSGLAQYVLPVSGYQRFLSRNRFYCFQRLVVFLGVHLRSLVFYSDGEIVSLRIPLNIGESPESEASHGF